MSNRARKIPELPKVTTLSTSDLFIVEVVGTSNSTTSAMTANSLIQALANVDIRARYATSSVAGVVKVGDGLTINANGVLSVYGSDLYANTTHAGIIKVGGGLVADANGYLSAIQQVLPANTTYLGGIKVGTGLEADANGTLSVVISGSTTGYPQTLITDSSYTLQSTDAGHHVYFSNGDVGFFSLYVPTDDAVNYPIGTYIKVVAPEDVSVGVFASEASNTRVFATGIAYTAGGYDIPAGGVGDLLKIDVNSWRLTGPGIQQD